MHDIFTDIIGYILQNAYRVCSKIYIHTIFKVYFCTKYENKSDFKIIKLAYIFEFFNDTRTTYASQFLPYM